MWRMQVSSCGQAASIHIWLHVLSAHAWRLQAQLPHEKTNVLFWKQEAPEVGSSMKTMEGLATSSTAIVRRLRCSTLRPYMPDAPHRADSGGRFNATCYMPTPLTLQQHYVNSANWQLQQTRGRKTC